MHQPPKTLILASGSAYRRQLLEKLHLPFECQSPNIDETPQPGESANDLVKRLSISKAQAIATQYSQQECLVIGSDQIAVLNDTILGKPLNHAKAKQQLQQCSGQTVHFLTGLCLINSKTNKLLYSCEQFNVTFRNLSDAQIEHYLLRDKPYDCAGSFKAEGLGIALFSRMQGDDPNSLIGLPLIQLVSLLESFGYPVL